MDGGDICACTECECGSWGALERWEEAAWRPEAWRHDGHCVTIGSIKEKGHERYLVSKMVIIKVMMWNE